MRPARPIVVLLASLMLGALAGCRIDNRSLKMSGSGGGSGSGQGGSGGLLGSGGVGGAALPTILLGDFENGTAQPQDARFAAYQYYAFNPSFDPHHPPAGDSLISPLVQPGYNSNYGLELNWKVIDLPDGVPNYPGVGVRTLLATGFVDLSGYDRIVFAQQYQHAGSCQAIQALEVSISCDELNTSYVGVVAVSSTWTNTTLAFKNMTEPSYAPPTGHTLAECLSVANGVVFNTQALSSLADGDCVSGNLSLDNIEIRAGQSGTDGGASVGILITPDQNGAFDGSNQAGVVGAWSSTGDDYASDGTQGTGTCPNDGFSQAQCSTITTPTPGKLFPPDVTGRMCTSGVAAQVIPDATTQPAYSDIWGNYIFFELNHLSSLAGDAGADAAAIDGGPGAGSSAGIYNATAHGITGFAFDLDGSVSNLRVEFATEGTETNPAYWYGIAADASPVSGPGHYEIRWVDVGGPHYLTSPPPFDPTKLKAIQFHVFSTAMAATSYAFCIKNTVMLTGP